MKIFITCALTAMLVMLDLLAGNIGIFPGFSVYGPVVLIMAYGWGYGIPAAAAAGMVIDVLYGHSFGGLTFLFALSALAGALIAERGHRQLAALFAGGVCTGFILASGILLAVKFSDGSIPGPDKISYLVFSAGIGGVWLILSAMIFDFFAARANLPRCITISSFDSSRSRPMRISRRSNGLTRRKRR